MTNALFLVIDSLRFDVLANPKARRLLAPNLARLCDQGSVLRVITNAQSTQFVMPSLFTLTYPLDYGGYNKGIRERPKSFIETLREAGYKTYKISNVNQIGYTLGYERGFEVELRTVDLRRILAERVDRYLRYEVEQQTKSAHGSKEAVRIVETEFALLLDKIKSVLESPGRSIWPSKLSRRNSKLAQGIEAEYLLLRRDPDTVLAKILEIPGVVYWRFLGKPMLSRVRRKLVIGRQFLFMKARRFIEERNFPPFSFLSHFPVTTGDILQKISETFAAARDEKWAAYLHLMDVHDCRAFNRPLHVIGRTRFLPKWLYARITGLTDRRWVYDTTLMYVDSCLGPILQVLEDTGQLNDTVIVVTGDHGLYFAESPRNRKYPVGLRTHYEDIEVPLILYGSDEIPENVGLIDSMGVTATFLEAVGVAKHTSFKGISAYAGGRDAVVSESCGSGNADIRHRDIYFTVTTERYRMMAQLKGADLAASDLYDLREDPRETNNIINSRGAPEVVREMFGHLYRERGELLAARGARNVAAAVTS